MAFRIFDLDCSVQGLYLWLVGSSSLTRNQTQAPCIGRAESQPLGHQGSPQIYILSDLESDFKRAHASRAGVLKVWPPPPSANSTHWEKYKVSAHPSE